jgi:hypothetical protein
VDICAIYINLAVCFKSSRLSGAFPLVDAFGTCYIISKLTEQLITAPGPLKALAGFEASSLESQYSFIPKTHMSVVPLS